MKNKTKNITIGVLGFGFTGEAVVKLALKKGMRVLVSDKRSKKDIEAEKGAKTIKAYEKKGAVFYFNGHDIKKLEQCDIIIPSPGVSWKEPIIQELIKQGKKVTGEYEFTLGFVKTPVIAITGTNGKTTLAYMIYNVLKSAGLKIVLAGHFGDWLTLREGNSGLLSERIEEANKADYVLSELGIDELQGAQTLKPKISIITNLVYHDDFKYSEEEYYEIKSNIIKAQDNYDYFILNQDDKKCKAIAKKTKAQIIGVSENQNANITIPTHHRAINVFMTLAVCKILKVKKKYLINFLKKDKGMKGRLSLVGLKKGVSYYNDARAQTIESLETSIKPFKNINLFCFLSEEEIKSQIIVKYDIKRIFAFNEQKKEDKKILGIDITYFNKDNIKAVLKKAIPLFRKGEVVIWSPGRNIRINQDFVFYSNLFEQTINKINN